MYVDCLHPAVHFGVCKGVEYNAPASEKDRNQVAAQTLYHLNQMAAAAGYARDIGRVVDKIVRAWLAKKEER